MARIHVGIISVYPNRAEKHTKSSGVASYTKNLVEAISKLGKIKISVYANIISKKEEYTENDNITVIRCWTPVFYPFQILKNIIKNRCREDVFHIQFEYFLYGGVLSLLGFPFLLFGLKLFNKPVILTLHQVVPLSKVDRRFIKENGFKGHPIVLKWGLKLFTFFIGLLLDRIIVHEDIFRERLVKEYKIPREKVLVIPHGVESPKRVFNKKVARKILKIDPKKRVILYMGYISGYKGVDILIDAFKQLDNRKYILILGGGVHPRLENDKKYIQELEKIKQNAKRASNIEFVGFIPEDQIPLYFSAADLVVFPYKVVFGSSGPMNIAIGYKRAVVASKEFKGIIPLELMFQNSSNDIAKKILDILRTPSKYKFAIKVSLKERHIRKWDLVAHKTVRTYEHLITAKYTTRR